MSWTCNFNWSSSTPKAANTVAKGASKLVSGAKSTVDRAVNSAKDIGKSLVDAFAYEKLKVCIVTPPKQRYGNNKYKPYTEACKVKNKVFRGEGLTIDEASSRIFKSESVMCDNKFSAYKVALDTANRVLNVQNAPSVSETEIIDFHHKHYNQIGYYEHYHVEGILEHPHIWYISNY